MEEIDKKKFLGLYQMLLIDAEVHPKELELLYEIGKEKGGITEEEIQEAIFSPNTLINLESLSSEDKIEYLYNLARIAWADGKIDDQEINLLQETSIRLGFGSENAEEISHFLIKEIKANKTFSEVLSTIENS
ncbi:MAG: hypothetical protein GC180_07515 [Bacteroidetes bacterium]|nr:hypothetical protein [Bacteroidota bacterium]